METQTQTLTAITGLPVGRRWGILTPTSGAVLFVRRPAADQYVVVAARRLGETMGEDPGSVTCGCPLQGRSHAHGETVVSTPAAAAELYDATDDLLARRQSVPWMRRVG